jgi:hypothetical protein
MPIGTGTLTSRTRPLLPPPPAPPRPLRPVKATKPSMFSAAMKGKKPR